MTGPSSTDDMKIIVVSPEYFPEDTLSRLEQIAQIYSKKLSRKELISEIGEYDGVLTRVDVRFDSEVLEKARKLKAIGTATTGLNHIDVGYANSRGIKIFNLSGTHTIPTAEHTFSLILSLARRVPWAFESLKKGEWERHRFFGSGLEGKTLGIIGFGRIGSRVAGFAKGFGMKVITYDPYVRESVIRSAGAKKASLDDVLRSDIISIHASLSKETKKMINSTAISRMKSSALLINTARGEIVDEKALLDALEKKRIAGAALDVFADEPLRKNSDLIKYAKLNDNLIITPHLGASTNEAVRESAMEIVGKMKDFFSIKAKDG